MQVGNFPRKLAYLSNDWRLWMSIVFAVSGTSGSGRSSIAHLACKLLDGLDLATSYTTRKRLVDKGDSDFVFTSRETFEHMIERKEFLEYASSFGNYYGTPIHHFQQAREKGHDLLIQVDDEGTQHIKETIPDAVSILILPGRAAHDPHEPGSTIEPTALSHFQEASLQIQTPNRDKYDHVIVNDRLEDSVNRLAEIIRSERSRARVAQV